jgi:guanylate kinase
MKSVEQEEFAGYMLALTGPSGVGKSTISGLLAQMFEPYVAKVPIITTRKRKDGDDGEYRYVSRRHFEQLQKSGALAAVTDIPSQDEERLYAYRKTDLEAIWAAGKIPVVVTEMHLLQGLAQTYGRRSLLSFGLLPPGKSKRTRLSQLLRRLRTRGRETEEQIAERLKNAEHDLKFFEDRSDLFDHLLVNEDLDGVLEMLKQRVPALKKA